ncbi:MAG: hypothetical protein QOI82_903 [Actinomycetota bacterium]|nr:hypothetical protein [Actinomycetota bacterium]
MSLVRKLLATTGAAALTALALGASPATAATPVSGGFANANGIIVDLTVLTAIPVPGPFGGTPIDPNTFASSSQSCPPTAAKSDPHELLNVGAEPAADANTIDTDAMAKCNVSDAVSSAAAQTEGLKALFNGAVPVITADVIRAQANSDCTKAPNAAGSQFVNLTIAGQAIPANPPPNTTIPLGPIGSVIVNEQHPSANGRGIVVNGLHVIGASPLLRGDLIISHAVSGVVCPNGAGSKFDPPLTKPDITFAKDANPSTAHAGDTVTYTATVTNTSAADCDVLRFFDHLDPAFDYVSTEGGFGKTVTTPAPKRSDGGTDVIVVPSGVTLAAGKSLTQTFVVTLKADVKPGTYYNNLELFCAVNGDFASGPLAPVTVPAPVVAPPPPPPAAPAPEQLPRTGGAPLLAAAGLLLMVGVAGIRRAATR